MDPDHTHCGPAHRQMTDVSLRSNLESRYWTQALGVNRVQLEDAVAAVGTNVELVMRHLGLRERRMSEQPQPPGLASPRARVE